MSVRGGRELEVDRGRHQQAVMGGGRDAAACSTDANLEVFPSSAKNSLPHSPVKNLDI